MTIVHTGKQNLQILANAKNRKEFVTQLEQELVCVVKGIVTGCLNAVLEEEANRMLMRKAYVRRKKSGERESEMRDDLRAVCTDF